MRILLHMANEADYVAFETWFAKDIEGDEEFGKYTAHQILTWASEQRDIITVDFGRKSYLEALLELPKSRESFRAFYSRTNVALPHPFRTARRVGGDHDRGFSQALNEEMRRRAMASNHRGALRPPVKGPTRG